MIKVRFLNFGCVLLRKSVFEKKRGISDRYFMYGEEPDVFCEYWALQLQVYLDTRTSVIHYREKSLRSVSLSKQFKIRGMATRNVLDATL